MSRFKRGLPIIAAGLIGSATGVGLGSTCFLEGIFGGCDKISKENRHAINSAIAHMNDMQAEWIRVQNVTNDKFYMVGHELKDPRSNGLDSSAKRPANDCSIYGLQKQHQSDAKL